MAVPSSVSETTQGPSRSQTFAHPIIAELSVISRQYTKRQNTIPNYFSSTKPLNVNQQKRIDEQLTKIIVKG